METQAVIFEKPQSLSLRALAIADPTADDVVVEIAYSGISTGTERLLWTGRMPHFPGLGYPLVPGYEAVGQVVEARQRSAYRPGDWVFVPGASCYGPVRGLFGGAAKRLVVAGSKAVQLHRASDERSTLLALAATAYHAIMAPRARLPDLIVGHGALGRLLARLTLSAGGHPPVVWERDPARRSGADGYSVVDPSQDGDGRYHAIYDASGDADVLDTLIGRLERGGEIVLVGFYETRPSFAFPPAFMREMRLRVSAEWAPGDLRDVAALVEAERLSLDGIVTHRTPAAEAAAAYTTAFEDPACLKMILDWRDA